jgi:hypothetical protein
MQHSLIPLVIMITWNRVPGDPTREFLIREGNVADLSASPEEAEGLDVWRRVFRQVVHHKDNITAIKATLRWHADRGKSKHPALWHNPQLQKMGADAEDALAYIKRTEGRLWEGHMGRAAEAEEGDGWEEGDGLVGGQGEGLAGTISPAVAPWSHHPLCIRSPLMHPPPTNPRIHTSMY